MSTLGTVLAGMLLGTCPPAFALNPALEVNQYAHTAWKIREGFSKGAIHSIAQTPDGYLWLGTEFGLLRFDGVRNVPWEPPPDHPLPSSTISRLLAARDGAFWIGPLSTRSFLDSLFLRSLRIAKARCGSAVWGLPLLGGSARFRKGMSSATEGTAGSVGVWQVCIRIAREISGRE